MKLTVNQQNAKEYLVQVWKQDSNGTASLDDDELIISEIYQGDEESQIELGEGEYLRIDPVGDE